MSVRSAFGGRRLGAGSRALRWLSGIVMPALMLSAVVAQPSLADEHGWHGDRHDHRHGGWHGDIRRFHDHDFDRWRGGRWYHGRHGGRAGWWWIVGPTWYFYPAPIYPYPDPYLPPTVPPTPGPGAQYWYCANPPGYYPYVPQCAVPWRLVLAPP
jgi:hypothetical protein